MDGRNILEKPDNEKNQSIKWIIIAAVIIISCLILWWLRSVIVWGLTGISIVASFISLVFLGLAVHEKYILKKPDNERLRSITDSGIAFSISIIFLVLVQGVGYVVLPDSNEKQIKKITKTGRTVKAIAGFEMEPALPDNLIEVSTLLNNGIKNLEVYIDGGTLHIFFDYPFSAWPYTTTACGANGSYVMSGRPLLVRYADENGKVLDYFTTKEKYISEWAKQIDILRPEVKNGKMIWIKNMYGDPIDDYIPLKEKNNHLVYTIDRRDADYIKIVQLSFDINKRDYLLKSQVAFGLENYKTFRGPKELEIDAQRKADRIKEVAERNAQFKKEELEKAAKEAEKTRRIKELTASIPALAKEFNKCQNIKDQVTVARSLIKSKEELQELQRDESVYRINIEKAPVPDWMKPEKIKNLEKEIPVLLQKIKDDNGTNKFALISKLIKLDDEYKELTERSLYLSLIENK